MGGFRLTGEILWQDWSEGKQTYAQLARKYCCSVRTIQRKIDSQTNKYPRRIILLMDTTYWGRGFGVMLFKDATTSENLLKYYVKYETNAKYLEGVEELKKQGFVIDTIIW